MRRINPAASGGDSGAHRKGTVCSFRLIVSRETCGLFPSDRTLTVPFRLQLVILNVVKNLPALRPTHPPRAEILRRGLLRMTKRSGDGRVPGLNEESFREEQTEITIVSRETLSRPPALCPSSNARLNFCRRPQNLFCARVQPHFGDQAGLAPCSGSSCPQSAKAREESEAVFDTSPRDPSIPAERSHLKTR